MLYKYTGYTAGGRYSEVTTSDFAIEQEVIDVKKTVERRNFFRLKL